MTAVLAAQPDALRSNHDGAHNDREGVQLVEFEQAVLVTSKANIDDVARNRFKRRGVCGSLRKRDLLRP
jgi:hypothetical protein